MLAVVNGPTRADGRRSGEGVSRGHWAYSSGRGREVGAALVMVNRPTRAR